MVQVELQSQQPKQSLRMPKGHLVINHTAADLENNTSERLHIQENPAPRNRMDMAQEEDI